VQEVDVVVAGGGPAGIAAAIAAARNGAKTLIVERYGYLGGMMTGSWVTWFLGFGDGDKQVVRGLTDEFVRRLGEVGGLVNARSKSGDVNSDVESIKWLAVVMLEEAGTKILLHSLVAATVVEGSAVKGIIVENKSGRQAVLAKVVIDATADGDVAHFAGAETHADKHDISLCLRVEGVDRQKFEEFKKTKPGELQKLLDTLKSQGGVEPASTDRFSGRSAIDVNDLTFMENDSRKRVMKGLMFMKKNVPGYENAKLARTAPQLGVRESRKIVGECTLTEEDILNSRKFSDTIGRCGAHMQGYQLYDVHGLDYDIPYRCLVPEKVDGLLAAGRCVSATHGAINTLRLIVPCMLTGEAAGTAAAIAVARGLPPRKVGVAELQDKLRKQGNNLG
jgi:ribulose 1,5-bisphosphate synthetase/thiazole synthase